MCPYSEEGRRHAIERLDALGLLDENGKVRQ
jgi:hypothetical protein